MDLRADAAAPRAIILRNAAAIVVTAAYVTVRNDRRRYRAGQPHSTYAAVRICGSRQGLAGLPIILPVGVIASKGDVGAFGRMEEQLATHAHVATEIGSASCRGRVCQ